MVLQRPVLIVVSLLLVLLFACSLAAFNLFLLMFQSYGIAEAASAAIVFNWDILSFVPMIGLNLGVISLVGRFGRGFLGRLGRGRRHTTLEHVEASFSIVEHVPGIASAGGNGLHVVLDADDRVGEALELVRIHHRFARCEPFLDHGADSLDDHDRSRLAEHE